MEISPISSDPLKNISILTLLRILSTYTNLNICFKNTNVQEFVDFYNNTPDRWIRLRMT